MKLEKGVIIAAYKTTGRTSRFMVLKRTKNWEGWEPPKGHLEEDDYEKTVEIELQEEAGIDPEDIISIEEMGEEFSWTYEQDGEEFRKEYKAFIVELPEDVHVNVENNPCDEHETGLFLRFRDAEALLTHDNSKELLEKAKETIQ